MTIWEEVKQKEEEKAFFRKYKSYYVDSVMRQIERRDLINENRESRMKLYDAIVK